MDYKTIAVYKTDGTRVELDVAILMENLKTAEAKRKFAIDVARQAADVRSKLYLATKFGNHPGLEAVLGKIPSREEMPDYVKSLEGLQWFYEQLTGDHLSL